MGTLLISKIREEYPDRMMLVRSPDATRPDHWGKTRRPQA